MISTSKISQDDGEPVRYSPIARRRRERILKQQNLGFSYVIEVDEAKTLDQSHILLTVVDIIDSLSNDRMIQHQATTLHCYKGQSFIVGSEGVTIGIGDGCGIKLPEETEAFEYHTAIKSVSTIEIENYKFVQVNYPNKKYALIDDLEKDFDNHDKISIVNGYSFVTGVLKWRVYAVPVAVSMNLSLFQSAKANSKKEFLKFLDHFQNFHNDRSVLLLNNLKEIRISLDSFHKNGSNGWRYKLTDEEFGKPYSILHKTVEYGSYDVVWILLELGFEIDLQCGEQLITPLHVAAIVNDLRMVKLLLKNGASVDVPDICERLPYMISSCPKIRKLLLTSMLLCNACRDNQKKDVKKILHEEDSDCVLINAAGERGYTPLLLSSMLGHYTIVEDLLHKKCNVGSRCKKFKRTALHYAVMNDHYAVVKLLTEYGASVTQKDKFGYEARDFVRSMPVYRLLWNNTPSFHMLVQCGELEAVRRYLEDAIMMQSIEFQLSIGEESTSDSKKRRSIQFIAKNIVNQQNEHGYAPLHLAVANGNIKLIEYLLENGSNINQSGGAERWSPLCLAAISCSEDVVASLLSLGADNNTPDIKGVNCADNVHQITMSLKKILDDAMLGRKQDLNEMDALFNRGMDKIVEVLLEYNADPYIKDSHYFTPMHTAAYSGHQNIVVIMLEHGVDPNVQTALEKYTALHLASMKNFYEVAQVLVKYGADISLKDFNNKKAFDLASNLNIRKLLATEVEHLYLAVCEGDMAEMEKLLKSSDVNIEFNEGLTPLHVAVQGNYLELVKYLVKHGADINSQDIVYRNTPLHNACQYATKEIVTYLLNNGASLTICNEDGKTPYEVTTNNDKRKSILEFQRIKSPQSNEDNLSVDQAEVCKICMENKVNTILDPCGHAVCCSSCIANVSLCPMDRMAVKSVKII